MKQNFFKTLLLCLFAITSMTAFAYDCEIDGIYYNLNQTNKTASVTYGVWYYGREYWNTYSGNVKIPSEIKYNGITYSVTSIGYGAFRSSGNLISIYIPKSIISIGENIFASDGDYEDCPNLETIIIEDGNPVYDSRDNCNAIIQRSGDEAILIAGCKNTKVPESVTAIGDYAFGWCSTLTSITIPGSVKSFGYGAFSHSGLVSVNISNGVTKTGKSTFSGCSNLTSINIPNSVTNIDDRTFSGCI